MTPEQSTFLQATGVPFLARESANVARIAKLEEELQAMKESLKQYRYRGTWDASTVYFAGNTATYDGSTFTCNVDGTQQRPGKGGDWQLSTKRGRDGRDGPSYAEVEAIADAAVRRKFNDTLQRTGAAA